MRSSTNFHVAAMHVMGQVIEAIAKIVSSVLRGLARQIAVTDCLDMSELTMASDDDHGSCPILL